jgi:small multidrug resistance pump
MQHWVYLAGAIVFDVAAMVSMKLSLGFTRLTPSVLIFVFYTVSFTALTLAVKKLDIAVVYAIWSGVGTLIIAIVGMTYFKEPATLLKIVSIGLIVVGVIGLNLSVMKG